MNLSSLFAKEKLPWNSSKEIYVIIKTEYEIEYIEYISLHIRWIKNAKFSRNLIFFALVWRIVVSV